MYVRNMNFRHQFNSTQWIFQKLVRSINVRLMLWLTHVSVAFKCYSLILNRNQADYDSKSILNRLRGDFTGFETVIFNILVKVMHINLLDSISLMRIMEFPAIIQRPKCELPFRLSMLLLHVTLWFFLASFSIWRISSWESKSVFFKSNCNSIVIYRLIQ